MLCAKGRLEHVTRLLGSALLPDLTEDRIRQYIKTRLSEGACGRTCSLELGKLSRAIRRTWREVWPKTRHLEERKDVGRALTPRRSIAHRSSGRRVSESETRCCTGSSRVALATGMKW